jgi:imidazolonepropionase-like amidohydrolase
LGAGVIKMMATGGMFTPTANPRRVQFSAATLAAAVAEAERMNVQIVAHTLSADGVRNCVEAGIHHLIHARWHHSDFSKGLDYDPEVVTRMAAQGQWVDPTLGHILLAEEAAAAGKAPKGTPHWAVTATKVPLEDHVETLAKMSEIGVRFTAGLDMGMAHGTHDRSAANAWAYHEWLGWDAWKAIRSNTVDTADAIRLGSTVGRIKPGMVADLAAFTGDPASNIRDLDRADSVVKDGRPVKVRGVPLA